MNVLRMSIQLKMNSKTFRQKIKNRSKKISSKENCLFYPSMTRSNLTGSSRGKTGNSPCWNFFLNGFFFFWYFFMRICKFGSWPHSRLAFPISILQFHEQIRARIQIIRDFREMEKSEIPDQPRFPRDGKIWDSGSTEISKRWINQIPYKTLIFDSSARMLKNLTKWTFCAWASDWKWIRKQLGKK